MPTNKTRVVLRGRLTKNPESNVTGTDKLVAHFSIAVDDDIPLADGSWRENTMFYLVEGWNRHAENIMKKYRKGDLVLIEGKLKQSRYTPAGMQEEHVITKIWVDQIDLVSSPKGKTHDDHTPARHTAEEENDAYYQERIEQGDVPF